MTKSQLFQINNAQVVIGRISPTLAVVSVRTVLLVDYVGPRPLPPEARTGRGTKFVQIRRPGQPVVKASETNLMIAQRLATQALPKKRHARTVLRTARRA